MIKQIVKWSLLVGAGFTLLVFIAGLAIPQSVLVKLSKKSTNAASLVSEKPAVADTAATIAAGQTGSTSSAQTPSQSQPTASQSSSTSGATTSTAPTSSQTAISPTTTTPPKTTPPTTPPTTTPPATASSVAPILTFSASPTSVVSGSSSTLSWSINSGATPAVTCTASGAWSGTKATSGSAGVTPGSSATYTLACSNTAGTSTQSTTVSVTAPPPACGSAGGGCTAAQISAHNTAGDCWVIYNTNYLILSGSGVVGSNGNEVANHSGGASRITPYCGANATSAFTSAHNGNNSIKNIFNSYIVGPVN
jgi:hypothetical protein